MRVLQSDPSRFASLLESVVFSEGSPYAHYAVSYYELTDDGLIVQDSEESDWTWTSTAFVFS